MRKTIILLLVLSVIYGSVTAGKVRPTKNLIVMIPDGTSLSVLSAARWLKTYKNEGTQLAIDPYLCGTVTTFCSNAPIGDSAPTTSCYMTGVPQQAGNVAIYPVADPKNDLVKLNPDSAYQPLATILEAMKIEQKKAAGLVVTCEFPHATPADCSSHTYNRSDYKTIASQMAYNNLDVMIGGGNDFVTADMKKHFEQSGTTFIQNDKDALMQFNGNKLWAIYEKEDVPYDIDRDSLKIPSLAQSTVKAIEVLNKNKNGFFLMVEGSKIDWAAHANDPVAIISEYLAFDKAVKAAIDFARKDKNTTVIILPDHGNSGFSIGRRDLKNYTKASIEQLFGGVAKIKKTATGIEQELNKTSHDNFRNKFLELTGIELTPEEETAMLNMKSVKSSDYTEASKTENLTNLIIKVIQSRSYFGFTTGGHTGEEVFLAAYHPKGDIPTGNLRNTALNTYLQKVSGLKKSLKTISSEIYVKHTDVFSGMNISVDKQADAFPLLTIKHNNKTLIIKGNSSMATLNGNPVNIVSVAVYVDKTNNFYLPIALRKMLL